MKKNVSYEKAMERLEEIVGLLEDGSLPLDKSLGLFEEASQLSAYCNKCLDEAELKITQFNSSVNAVNEEEFDA
ncbi:MAG: exodeoxyribonuclease VII small subunit [Oscillospiraceae bacterium]|jgi:exodeoxyribonuclease VII small subunit|nr:exodeoxyribonuclease VII small subunit [Oscillospiraceae bacterium]